MEYENQQGLMRSRPNYDDLKKPNDENRYLRGGCSQAKKEAGKDNGKKSKGNYGDEKGMDNKIYSNRGKEHPDAAKLSKQAKPNDRMYTYLQ